MSDVIQEIEVMYFNKTRVILEIRPKIPVLSPWSKEYGPNHLGTKSCNQHGHMVKYYLFVPINYIEFRVDFRKTNRPYKVKCCVGLL